MSEPVLFLARRGPNRLDLIAALEERHAGALGREGARARIQLVPGLAPLVHDDVRGRRIALGTLLQPNEAGWDTDEPISTELCDVAGHLIELPEVGTPGAGGDQRHPLRLRLIDDSVPLLQPLWPAPGGGWFEIDVAPLRLEAAGFSHAAILSGAGHDRPTELSVALGAEPRIAALVALLREAGVGGCAPLQRSFLRDWVQRDRESGGAALEGKRAEQALELLRHALGAALRTGEPGAAERKSATATVRHQPGDPAADWIFTLQLEEERFELTQPTARVTARVLAQLAGLRPSVLAPHWLLLFAGGAGRTAQLETVVDARRFLLAHPETWRFGGDVPRALELGTSLLHEGTDSTAGDGEESES